MKQLPNLFTLLNLVCGCIALTLIMQPGLTYSLNDYGQQLVVIPPKMYWSALFIGIAAVVDFLDGFVARAFKATSELGKQIDSLADLVSFGVAPGMIAYQFLRLSYAHQDNGLDINMLWIIPAFIIPCAGAYRLARFNIDTTQSHGFKGVPIPAAGLVMASFPLIYFFTNNVQIINLLQNKWFWYAVILTISYLMVSTLPMLALKFKGVTVQKLLPFIIIAAVAIIAAFVAGWLAVPIAFSTYVIVSLVFAKKQSS